MSKESESAILRDCRPIITPATDAENLAALAIEVLDAQQKYFKSRDRADLIASKQLESRLRKEARSILTTLPIEERKKLAAQFHDGLREAMKEPG